MCLKSFSGEIRRTVFVELRVWNNVIFMPTLAKTKVLNWY